MNIYYNILVGGLSGLVAWLLLSLLPGLEDLPVWARALSKGALIGVLIGGGLGIVEGALDRSSHRAMLGMGIGAGAGLCGGALGLLMGEVALAGAGGGLVGRALGWTVLGAAVGIGGGLSLQSAQKVGYGSLGGAMGGFLGGFILESLTQSQASEPKPWMVGIGLVILGAFIGALIAIVEEVLVKAKLKAITGVLEGRDFNLTKKVTTLGSDERCDVYLPSDKGIRMRHAEIRQDGKAFALYPTPDSVVQVNKKAALAGHVLDHNDRVQLGNTLLLFSYEGRREGNG